MRLARMAGLLAALGTIAASAGAQTPTGAISGRVTTAASGEPVAGATIRVGATRFGAVTEADGRYTVRAVPAGTYVVRVVRLGFGPDSQTVTVAEGQTATANFTLRQLATQLEAVVSTGYGTTTRRELTGSVASVSSEEIQAVPVTSVDQALLGRAPGVQVITASGQPGATATVRVRGGNSISAGNDPLYVIDGVPVTASPSGANTNTLQTQGVSGLNPLASLNPDDIASIDVLKDASAAAIYGARAANGVIVITTKRGHSGKPQVNVGAWYGVAQVRHQLPLLNAQQFAQEANQARTNSGQPALYTPAQIAAFGTGTDWQDAIFRSAPSRNVDLSFSGGDANTRYYLSGNLYQQEGVVIGTHLGRGTLRLNLDQDVSDRFRVGTHVTVSRDQGKVMPNGGAGQTASSVIINALQAPPTLPVTGTGGEYFVGINPANGRFFANPVATALLVTNDEQQNRFVGNAFGEYDLLEGLTFRSSFGADYLSSMQDYFSPSNTMPGALTNGLASRGAQGTTTWLNENTLHFTRALRGSDQLDLLGGVTFQRTNASSVSGTSQFFSTDALGENGLNQAGVYYGIWSGAPHYSLLSYLARANYNLLDRYLFTVSGRVDGSSRFGSANRYGAFPSAAFAWRASKEGFVERLGWFDDLKFRASYGRTGNQDIANYGALATLEPSFYLFKGYKATGQAPTSLANPNLKWETTDQADLGADVAVLGNRLAITADYYDKKTKDLLLWVSVPATLGVNGMWDNVGSLQNRGFELSVNTVNLVGTLGWTSALNLAWNRNKVLDIGARDVWTSPGGGVGAGAVQDPTVLVVGKPVGSFYGYVYAGMQNGVPTYRDLNNDGQINSDDKTIIGSAQPNYTGGLSNRLTWGPLGLDVFLQFSVGNKIYNINRSFLQNNGGMGNQLTDVLDAGSTGANGIPAPKYGYGYDNYPSTLFVEDGSYLRGKNLRLDYTVPASLLDRARIGGIGSARLYVSVQNFFTATHYTGFDPEVSEYATSSLNEGIDFGTYPQTRQFTIGFTAGF